MAENSKIEWTDHTFNPWTGCTKVSPGCEHCYAESWAKRSGTVRWGAGEPRRRTTEANWRLPRKWNAQAEREGRRFRVFCSSLADVFDNAVPPEWRSDLFELIDETPHLDWLLLTKRVGNVPNMLPVPFDFDKLYPHVIIGSTIVNREEMLRDGPKLKDAGATRTFWSVEPMLGDLGEVPRELFPDWVICGGESGPGARPMHPDWARSLRDQCASAGVPFLFKQWGEWTPDDWGEQSGLRDTAGVLPSGEFVLMSQGYVPPFDDGERLRAAGNVRLDGRTLMDRVGKKAAGRLLDGVEHNGFPT